MLHIEEGRVPIASPMRRVARPFRPKRVLESAFGGLGPPGSHSSPIHILSLSS
jgi:hypothetical protein